MHELYVLLLQEGDYWVAQCLQHDVAAQGRTPEEARLAFLRTLVGQIQLGLLASTPAAPSSYWTLWGKAVAHQQPAPVEIPSDVAPPPAYMISSLVA